MPSKISQLKISSNTIIFFCFYVAVSTTVGNQPLIGGFLQGDDVQCKSYGKGHPQQQHREISLIENLIISCALPLSIVENKHFQTFCRDLDSKFQLPSRSHLSSVMIPNLAAEKDLAVKRKLASAQYISLTTDIWTDRRCHSFLAVTAHIFVICVSETMLIAFVDFKGSHTGKSIAEKLDKILVKNAIRDKVIYIVTDNAANMLKAIMVMNELRPGNDDFETADDSDHEAATGSESNSDETDYENEGLLITDDESMWQSLDAEDEETVNQYTDTLGSRLSCFAHTLQLVIKDGMIKVSAAKDQNMKGVLAKCVKLSSMCHQSALFRGTFETCFGQGRSIPVANATRWSSTYTQLRAICNFDQGKLTELLRSQDHNNLVISVREMSVLREFVDILQPFAEATERVQGDTYTTIGCVVPTVIGLFKYLNSMQQTCKYHGQTIRALMDSLVTRFGGLLTNVFILDDPSNTGFKSIIYPMASVLDPNYGFIWLEDQLPCSEGVKQQLTSQLQSEIINLAEKVCPTGKYI